MKHCPACNFSFPDFHKVCDFDGTELVPDTERVALIKRPRPQSQFQRTLQSPVLWAIALLMFVLSSAFLVAYLEATVQSPSSATAEPAAASSSVKAHSAAVVSDDVSSDRETRVAKRTLTSRKPAGSTAVKARRQASALRSVQRREQRPSNARAQTTETARRESVRPEMKSSRQVSEDKEPKVIAALKTTWRVLKKPFKF